MITLWWISFALELAVAARILASRLLKDLPALFAFVLFNAASDLALAGVWSKPHYYEIAWSIIQASSVAAQILLALELYLAYARLYKPDRASQRLLAGCLIASVTIGLVMLQFQPKADERTTPILLLSYIWCTFALWWSAGFMILFGFAFHLVSIRPAPNLTVHARLLACYFAIQLCTQILVDASVHQTRAASIVRITAGSLCLAAWALLLRRGGFERHTPNPKIAEAARAMREQILSEISDPAGRESFHTSGED